VYSTLCYYYCYHRLYLQAFVFLLDFKTVIHLFGYSASIVNKNSVQYSNIPILSVVFL